MIPSCPKIEIDFNEFLNLIWLWPYMVPQLHYIRRKPSQAFDPTKRTLPQSVDNVYRAKSLPVLKLLLVLKKEVDRQSHFTWKELLSVSL